MTLFLSLSVTTMEVTTMWIKTVGGYLLNTDKLAYIKYDPETNYTQGYDDDGLYHIISEGDYTDIIFNAAFRAANVLEVR